MVYVPDELDIHYLYKFLFELSSAWDVDLAENSVTLFETEPEIDPVPYLKFLKDHHYIEIGAVRVSGKEYTYFRITDQGFRYRDQLFEDLRS